MNATTLISIHAPRVGSDHDLRHADPPTGYFNPRSPCGERPAANVALSYNGKNFNPRSPCGERPVITSSGYEYFDFNPRSPCGERLREDHPQMVDTIFQSTLPVWGATAERWQVRLVYAISIHAPRVGSDRPYVGTPAKTTHFNPRSPCGERQAMRTQARAEAVFQSTLPVWGATKTEKVFPVIPRFQSTLPVWGATMYLEGRTVSCQKDFNPRSPCGERRPATKDLKDADRISIHAPRVGSDTEALVMGLPAAEISIHAPRVGSDIQGRG